ncbi:Reverse transcriptase zinc-binding domain-containing protein [Hirschfeldia incana]|nr:Reverse transcriptase zinc-binding domain-containing protein [Hirschfeldia incana]
MNAGFFRHHWAIIKQGVISHVKHFFDHSQLDPRINHTHICLIPKIDSPNTVKDYRPISLSNVAYKIISKILAERLKPWLNSVITENQSAFIPGRLITDNVLIAHELMHSLHTKNLKTKYMALKLDISKAFDKVEWGFIIAVMRQMGFCETWCKWIHTCMSTASYSVLVNGEPLKPISPSRGIRQVFCRATEEECQNLMNTLGEYQRASGQAVNFSKSAITFAKGISQSTQENLIKMTGITRIGGFGKYLGLPEKIGRKRKDAFEYIKQRIRNKLDSWYNKFLTPAGREVLLKAVITALPTYTMTCFLLPKGLIQEITAAMRNFWWSGQKDRQKIPWISWKKITASKQEGGLGIRDLENFNLALLAKQGWRILRNPSSLLTRVLKAKYFRHTEFLQAPIYKSSSYAWRSILKSRVILQKGIKWIVGDGKKIRVWEDRWLHSQPATPAQGEGQISFPNMKVEDLMLQGAGEWNEQLVTSLMKQEDARYILNTRLSSTMKQDTPIWNYTSTGEYNVKSGYHLCNQLLNIQRSGQQENRGLSEELKRSCFSIWSLTLPPKIKTFWWRILHDGLPVAENLRKRNIKIDNACQICGEYPETQDHMFFQCRVAKEIWTMAPTRFGNEEEVQPQSHQNVKMLTSLVKKDKRELLNFFIGWRLWKMRNNLVFQQKREHIVKVIYDAVRDLDQWNEATLKLNQEEGEEVRRKGQACQIQEIVPPGTQYYCYVDASWKDDKEVAGVGWSLHSIQGNQQLQGSSSIRPINTPKEAETEALRMAVRQMRALAYTNVHFKSDCKSLMDELAQYTTRATITKVRNTESISMIQDIVEASKANGFTFSYVPRSSLMLVDEIAKKARCNNQNYVITWF